MKKTLPINIIAAVFLLPSVAHSLPRMESQILSIVTDTTSLNKNRSGQAAEPGLENIRLQKSTAQVSVSAEGDTRWMADYSKNQLHGDWKSFYPGRIPCDSGTFRKGIPDGTWKTWYPNGQLRSIRTYHARKMKYIRLDMIRRHPRAGYYALSLIYRENPAEALKYFNGNYSYSDYFASGRPHPQTREEIILFNTDPENPYYYPPFLECLHHGLYMNFNEDGSIRDSGHYENGLPHGLWTEWIDNNRIKSTGLYFRGSRVGLWRYYSPAGIFLYQRRFHSRKR